MQLSSRADQILRILVRFPRTQPITAAAISEDLGVSRRSIQRELPDIEKWLRLHGFHLVRKPGSGLLLDEPPERRQDLIMLLEQQSHTLINQDRYQRQKFLIRELLATDEPIKAYYFTRKLKVSNGTLSSDLDQVGHWLSKYHLKLVRRPGLGIFIDGTKANRQLAISSIICEQLTEKQLLGILRSDDHSDIPLRSHFIDGIDADVMDHAEIALEQCEEQLGIRFSDSGFMGLFVHLSLALQRLRTGDAITLEPEKLQKLAILPEYVVAESIAKYLSNALHLHIPSDEIGFITMHLTSARIWPGTPKEIDPPRAVNIRQTVLAIIDIVGQHLNMDFRWDETLIDDLCNHIQPTIGRLRAGIPVDNPQLEYLRTQYSHIYEASEHGAQVLCQLLDLTSVPPSEIGFIAMHFGASIERRRSQMHRISAIIVCPTGIGTSRLLSAGLQREYPNIDIHGTLSAFQLDPVRLRRDGIDLVISTVDLNIDYPLLRVSPVLSMQDKMLLGTAIDSLLQKKSAAPPPQEMQPHPLTQDDVIFINTLGNEIYALLDGLMIRRATLKFNRDDLIDESALLFTDIPAIQEALADVFHKRNELGDTYIEPFQALLLHGKTPWIKHPCFGYVSMEPPMYEAGRPLLGAIVMLIPDNEATDVCAQIMSEISGLLLEDPLLLNVMRSGNVERMRETLETLLLQFYKRTIHHRLSNGI